ncbi:MAG: deoxyguanosinetriphosphate triphosphohydrolase [Gammaproteobacteria bacterium]|nr:deoxyguanosinetriphosphate triphosphohydrolase [Gammaproteobacteria bacterium]MYF67791.1 deoxyguanosinetriphosphate triphosphohydrolase [Gammaproteobacteria bacterium]MYK37926.1 deoxyguanosinetriphosphate triphosphohydrolase [Gammaproteobacteria bacterium]
MTTAAAWRGRDTTLAPWAVRDEQTRGRVHAEPGHPYRSPFQRDRDRIIHCRAFRRLMHKTQVFVAGEGDHFRTRLTHTMEVAQIARTVAACLRLNQDLTEAICLGHDLGHPPFGHAGQTALNRCMADHGGFEHNLQALRIVDMLEHRYPGFPGLNLCWETREGLLKRCSRRQARALGDLGERFIRRSQPSLEAQLANVADEIAYNHHDLDDGLRSGLLDPGELMDVRLFRESRDEAAGRFPTADGGSLASEAIRGMIDRVVSDLIETTSANLKEAMPEDADAVRSRSMPLVGLSDPADKRHRELARFLTERLYHHPRMQQEYARGGAVVDALFNHYINHPDQMPGRHSPDRECGAGALARAVADYIAGMTDRYASRRCRALALDS